jgi:hypothetical protein
MQNTPSPQPGTNRPVERQPPASCPHPEPGTVLGDNWGEEIGQGHRGLKFDKYLLCEKAIINTMSRSTYDNPMIIPEDKTGSERSKQEAEPKLTFTRIRLQRQLLFYFLLLYFFWQYWDLNSGPHLLGLLSGWSFGSALPACPLLAVGGL